MSAPENALLVREALTAFRQGRLSDLTRLISEDVTWHSPGSNALSGTYRGHAGLLEYLKKVSQVGLPFEVNDLTASDKHVIALMRDTFRRPDGQVYEHMGCLVCRVADGRVAEVWAINNEQATYDALLAEHIAMRPDGVRR